MRYRLLLLLFLLWLWLLLLLSDAAANDVANEYKTPAIITHIYAEDDCP